MQNIKGIAQGVLKISPFENWSGPHRNDEKTRKNGGKKRGNLKSKCEQNYNAFVPLLTKKIITSLYPGLKPRNFACRHRN